MYSATTELTFSLFFAGNALDELHLDDPLNLVDSIHRDTNSPIGNSISAGLASSGLLGSSAPVNIPGMTERSVLTNFSPSTSSPLQQLQSSGFLTGSRFSHQDSIESVSRDFFSSARFSTSSRRPRFNAEDKTLRDYFTDFFPKTLCFQTLPFINQISDPFSNHISQLSSSASKLSGFNSSLFDFASQGMSPSRTQPTLPASPLVNAFSISPSNTGSLSEVRTACVFLKNEFSIYLVEYEFLCVHVYVCVGIYQIVTHGSRANVADTKAPRRIDVEPRTTGDMGRAY